MSAPAERTPPAAFDHDALWRAIDTLAAEHGLSPSGLARESGLDPTAFNPSKRRDPRSGAPRWPTLATLSLVLGATGTSLDVFARLVGGARTLPGLAHSAAAAPMAGAPAPGRLPMLPIERLHRAGLFDAGGHPQGSGWSDIELPAPAPPGSYAVSLEHGCAPLYRPRTLLIVDPEAVTREGDVALRFDSSGLALVRVLGPDGLCAPIEAQAQDHPGPFDGVVLLRLHRVAWASQ